MSETYYSFIPSVRMGLAAATTNRVAEAQAGPSGPRASVTVSLRVVARRKGADGTDEESIDRQVQLYGPGDVLGFDSRVVARTDPRPNVNDFEPNYFPAVEFADADFAWRFTPGAADAQGQPVPWITLIVLVSEDRGADIHREFDEEAPLERHLPRRIGVLDSHSLPDLDHAWRWAHVHVSGGDDLQASNHAELHRILAEEPERAVCRLLCPRRLRPRTGYSAFVVPTFRQGRQAGLGEPIELAYDPATWKAWSNDGAPVSLPYYFRLDFRTGERGDFEQLVRLLEGRMLKGLGIRGLDCGRPGYGISTVERIDVRAAAPHVLDLEGALRSLDTQYSEWGHDARIDNVVVTPQADRATIQWTTTAPGSSRVEYGETTTLDLMLEDPTPETDHSQVITGLMAGATYHYQIVSTFADQSTSRTMLATFQAAAGPPIPRIGAFAWPGELSGLLNRAHLDLQPRSLTVAPTPGDALQSLSIYARGEGDAAIVSWQSAANLLGHIDYGETDAYGQQVEDTQPRERGALVLRPLTPGTTYHLRLSLLDGSDQAVASRTASFETPPLPSVVPPIYGRWHAARRTVSASAAADDWLNVLNLDPRHRVSAGLGAQVVRKQQEDLMASAWDQLGAYESANDVVRRGQFGREASNWLYRRIGNFGVEAALKVTRPVQRRVLIDDPEGGRITARAVLDAKSRVPAAVLDPAMRRKLRPRGPLRRRQRAQPAGDMLRRLAAGTLVAAGEPPTPAGTRTLCDVTRKLAESLRLSLMLTAEPQVVATGGSTTLSWSSENATAAVASGAWQGSRLDRHQHLRTDCGGPGRQRQTVGDDHGGARCAGSGNPGQWGRRPG
jgi:hypothetical protein